MNIFTDNFNLHIKKNYIIFNDDKLTLTDKDLFDYFCTSGKGIEHLNINQIPQSLDRITALILAGLTKGGVKTFYDVQKKEYYELTFSYHFPLYYEPHFLNFIQENIDLLVRGNLINFATKGEFIKVNLSDIQAFSNFEKRYNGLLRRNDKIFEILFDSIDIKSVLRNWNRYCIAKHNKKFSSAALNAYNIIYSLKDFHIVQYLYKNKVVAEGVVFISPETKTLYYCIFHWDEAVFKYSPGIYNYVKTIDFCYKHNYNFSFCYGFQEYKLNIIKDFVTINKNETWTQKLR